MRLIPVIDLKEGRVVRAVAGQRQRYQPVQSVLAADPQPRTVATAFRDAGFDTVYVADLDAIGGASPNWLALQTIAARGLNLLLDAGVDGIGRASQLAFYAADQPRLSGIVLGLESLPNPELLSACVQVVGRRQSVFSLDLHRGRPITVWPAWQQASAGQIAADAIAAGLARLIVLDLAHVGTARGPRIGELCRQLRSEHPAVEILAGGGVRHLQDLEELRAAGCNAALVASALHDGTLLPPRAGLKPNGPPASPY